ncbi:MAG: V-type ATP synthase subunit D [Bacteroidota bacterium]
MALKFQYNKTIIQQFRKQLSIREKALPILKNKETALRTEAKEALKRLAELKKEREAIGKKLEAFSKFWFEFPHVLVLQDEGIYTKKVVGVNLPEVGEVEFEVEDISWKEYPSWVPAGVDILKQVITCDIKIDTIAKQAHLLDLARKKTTQKVNLYEKVQIPAYEDAILKIKRFLEDKENISKAAQKIVKKKKERRAAA